MFPFRKAKDETDEFTRIREAVRVEPAPAAPPADDTSWVRPLAPGQAATMGVPPATSPGGYSIPGQQPTVAPIQAPSGTVIFQDASFDGTLQSQGSIHIQGRVSGRVRAAETVYVAREARVEASIEAATVIVAGDVVGDITCSGKLEVIPTGRVSGEVDAGRLVIHEGAFINSAFKMAAAGAKAARGEAPARGTGGGSPNGPSL